LSAPKLPLPRAPGSPSSSSVASRERGAWKKEPGGASLKASFVPLLLGIATITAGIVLLVVVTSTPAGASIVSIGLLGYFLSGFATPLLWGWDAAAQRRGQVNPNFSAKRQYSRALRLLTLIGIVVAIVHLLFVSTVIAEKLSEWLFVAGLVGV